MNSTVLALLLLTSLNGLPARDGLAPKDGKRPVQGQTAIVSAQSTQPARQQPLLLRLDRQLSRTPLQVAKAE